MPGQPQEPFELVRAIEDVSLRMLEALAAQDLWGIEELLSERQSLISRLVEIDASEITKDLYCQQSPTGVIMNKIKEIVASGDSLISSVEDAQRSVQERRCHNSVARKALRSYLSTIDEPIRSRGFDG